MSHTKGEWRPRKGPKDSDKWWDIPRPDSTSCITTIWSAPDDEETIANAHIIAAAPDLLKACEYTQNLLSKGIGQNTHALALIEAAISKAKKE